MGIEKELVHNYLVPVDPVTEESLAQNRTNISNKFIAVEALSDTPSQKMGTLSEQGGQTAEYQNPFLTVG